MYRYFSHKDNPEKYQYDEGEISTYNGFNIADLVELTRSEVNELKAKVLRLIRDVGIVEYASLIDFLIDNGMTSEYDVAINNTMFFNTYICSKRNAERQIAEEFAKLEAARLQAARKAARQISEEYRESTPFD